MDPFAGGMVGEDDSPAVLPPKPTAPPPTKVLPVKASSQFKSNYFTEM